MEHTITVDDIDRRPLVFTIASASEGGEGEYKDLRLVLDQGKVSYVARYFKHGELIKASHPLGNLATAIRVYNSL